MHPTIHRWTERDPRAFRTIRRIATLLIVTGLLPIALLFGLLLLLGHATLTLGTVPLPALLVDASPIAADVRAAPATYRAAQSDPLGLNDIGRAPPIHITDAATAIATVTLALALWLIPVFADALAIGHMASGRIYPHDLAPHARGALPRAATPRAPPLTA